MQYGIAPRAFNFESIVGKIKELLEAFHAHGRPVIYSQHTGLPYEYLSKSMLAFIQKRGLDPKKGGFLQEGTRDWEIVKELSPANTDLVLRKYTGSFFIGTILDQLLKNRGIDSVVLVGVSTEGGIEGTARNASYLGYLVVIAEDAVGSFDRESHELSLKLMHRVFEVRKTELILADIRTER